MKSVSVPLNIPNVLSLYRLYSFPFLMIFIFLGLFAFSRLYFLFKFKKMHGFHAYSGKAGGYIHGSFFMVLFVAGFYEWFYYIMIISGYIICIENILITKTLKECRSNVKGLYWLLKEKEDAQRMKLSV